MRRRWIALVVLVMLAGLGATFWARPVSVFRVFNEAQMYLIGATNHYTTVNGYRIHYYALGPERGRPVVLVHGGYGQGADWISTPDGRRGWASLLVERGYQVYVVDRPGQGRPPYFPWFHGYFDQHAQTFEGVAKELGLDASDAAVVQAVASKGQPMTNNAITRQVWGTRGAMLLDKIGPAVFLVHSAAGPS